MVWFLEYPIVFYKQDGLSPILPTFVSKNVQVGVQKHLTVSLDICYYRFIRGYVPRGNLSAGVFTKVQDVSALKSCVMKCCVDEKCNVALMMDTNCYHVACASNDLCVPTPSGSLESTDRVAMVLVQPTDEDSWEDVLAQGSDFFKISCIIVESSCIML